MSLFLHVPDSVVLLSTLIDIPSVVQIAQIIFCLMILFHSDILGTSCQSPYEDQQAESGIDIYKNSVLPQQVGNLSRVCVVIQDM